MNPGRPISHGLIIYNPRWAEPARAARQINGNPTECLKPIFMGQNVLAFSQGKFHVLTLNTQSYAVTCRSALTASPLLKWGTRNPPHLFVSANVSIPAVEMMVEEHVFFPARGAPRTDPAKPLSINLHDL